MKAALPPFVEELKAERFKGMNDFLPTREIEFVGGVTFQGTQDLHFGNSHSVGKHESHLSPIVMESLADGLVAFRMR